MNTITVQAHFDGQQIRLDEPFVLKRGTKLFVAIVLDEPVDEECQDWLRLAESGLNAAYGQDEVEYTLDLIWRWREKLVRKSATGRGLTYVKR